MLEIVSFQPQTLITAS